MKRHPVSLPGVPILILLLLLLTALPVAADGIIIPQPPVDRPLPWRDIPLTIKYHHVDVSIEDQVATTRVDQVFLNENNFPVEGTYMFPLPEDAAISSFDMWVDGEKLEGRLLDREEARAIYEEIVRRQRDPALLEYMGRGAFQASIFPIPPGGERRVELSYSQVLPQVDGLVHYRYPLNTEKFSARPLEEVAITVDLSDHAPLRAIYSSSHRVDVLRDGDYRATVSYEEHDLLPDRDFDLYYSLSPDPIAVNLLSYKPFDEDGFFLLLVTPPIAVADNAVVDRDVILVLDVSGSMDGEKLIQAKAAADYVLDHLGEGDRFNLIAFSSATRLFAAEPVPQSRLADGHTFVRKLTAQGSTDINRSLLEALAGADPERPTVLIFLTDGLPTAGEVDPDRILTNVVDNAPQSVRLFAFGVGYDVDTFLLDELSARQRGASAYVQPGQKIDEEVSGFYAKISAPVLVDVRLTFDGGQAEDIYPYPLPDLFAGAQLVVVGRYPAGGVADLRLAGTVNGEQQAFTYRELRFVDRGGSEFIPRLWAQRKIGYLLAQIRLHGANDELVDEIVALSTRYGIVTPYTSFLVEEPEMALTDAGRDRLSRELQAPGLAGGAEAPAALAPQVRSGEAAVERAVVEKQLATADEVAAPATEQIRQVRDKAFVRQDGVWLDTTFDGNRMTAEAVAFGSDRYFELLADQPEIGAYLALGDSVVVVFADRAYVISPGGELMAGQSVISPTVETPGLPTPASPSPEPTSPSREQLQPTTPPPAASSAGPSSGVPAICSGAALVGLMGLVLPIWSRRRC